MTLAAVILAGGRGERLGGVRKAQLRVGGATLLERVRGALPPAAQVLVSIGHQEPGEARIPFGIRVVRDQTTAFGGPLAGLAAAVLALRGSGAHTLLTASVDTPFLPPTLFPALLEAMGGRSGAIASGGGQLHPTIAAWRLSALRDLPQAVAAGTAPRSLKHLALQHDAAILDWAPSPPDDVFDGVNTIAELLRAQRRARLVETPAT